MGGDQKFAAMKKPPVKTPKGTDTFWSSGVRQQPGFMKWLLGGQRGDILDKLLLSAARGAKDARDLGAVPPPEITHPPETPSQILMAYLQNYGMHVQSSLTSEPRAVNPNRQDVRPMESQNFFPTSTSIVSSVVNRLPEINFNLFGQPVLAAPPGSVEVDIMMGDSYMAGEGGRWVGNAHGANEAATNRENRLRIPGFSDASGRTPQELYPDSWTDRRGGGTDPGCHRSDIAEGKYSQNNIILACSGATTNDILNGGFRNEPSQLEFLESILDNPRYTVKNIFISIGGNDVNLSGVGTDCVLDYLGYGAPSHLPVGNKCTSDSPLMDPKSSTYSDLGRKLDTVINRVKNLVAGKSINIVMQSYSQPVAENLRPLVSRYVTQEQTFRDLLNAIRHPTSITRLPGDLITDIASLPWARAMYDGLPMEQRHIALLKAAGDNLNDLIEETALSHRVNFLDVRGATGGHELGTDTTMTQKLKHVDTDAAGKPVLVGKHHVKDLEWIVSVDGAIGDALNLPGSRQRKQESLHPNALGILSQQACAQDFAGKLNARTTSTPMIGHCQVHPSGLPRYTRAALDDPPHLFGEWSLRIYDIRLRKANEGGENEIFGHVTLDGYKVFGKSRNDPMPVREGEGLLRPQDMAAALVNECFIKIQKNGREDKTCKLEYEIWEKDTFGDDRLAWSEHVTDPKDLELGADFIGGLIKGKGDPAGRTFTYTMITGGAQGQVDVTIAFEKKYHTPLPPPSPERS